MRDAARKKGLERLKAGLRRAASFRIGDSGLRGKGVFAAGPIPALTRIANYCGKTRWIWDIPRDLWPYTFQVDYDRYKLPRRNTIGWYINHSCSPNCVISGSSILARRDIKRGEELTFDYSTDVDWPGFAMKCRCGSLNCRGTIRAYRFLPKELKLRYGERAAPFIVKKYGILSHARPARLTPRY